MKVKESLSILKAGKSYQEVFLAHDAIPLEGSINKNTKRKHKKKIKVFLIISIQNNIKHKNNKHLYLKSESK